MSVGKNPQVVQFDLHSIAFMYILKTDTYYGIHIQYPEYGFKVTNIKGRKRTYIDTSQQSLQSYNYDYLMKGNQLAHFIEDLNVQSGEDDINLYFQKVENKIISKFHKLVSEGPDYVCSCCTQTFFRHNVQKSENLPDVTKQRFLTNFVSVDMCEWVCLTCFRCLKSGKTPSLWIHNGLKFPAKPSELNLTSLEERLVSPRLPFMQLREMPRGGQLNLRGNIVNVPADVNNTIKSLPRMMDENETIMLKLKRSLQYKHHVSFENIRPTQVFEAAKWLVSNSSLFRTEGIEVNNTWLQQPSQAFSIQSEPCDTTAECSNDATAVQSDCWTEDENFNDRPTGNLDTCLQSVDFREFNQVLSLAPGEKNTPLGLFQDIYSEILSFPTIFCGQARTDNEKRQVPLHYSAICKWELRNVDRRVATCVPNIFYK